MRTRLDFKRAVLIAVQQEALSLSKSGLLLVRLHIRGTASARRWTPHRGPTVNDRRFGETLECERFRSLTFCLLTTALRF
jgi:hypothetical protein